MEIEEQKKTFEVFTNWTKRGIIIAVVILLFLASIA